MRGRYLSPNSGVMPPSGTSSGAKPDAGQDEVVRLFDRSDALHEAAGQVLAQTGPPPDRRAFLAISFAVVSLEHWGAQRILLREGLNVSGFAMVRLQFEATIRAVWTLECAKDDWLERFSAPVPEGQLEEPVLGPPVEAMLSTIAKKAPVIARMLQQLKDGAWVPMHSYVHGGARPIVQALVGTSLYQISAVLRNANGLALIAINAITRACRDATLGGQVAKLQREHMDCLPPPKPL